MALTSISSVLARVACFVFVRFVGSDGSAVMAGDGLSVVDDVLSGVWQKREQSE